MKHGIQRHDTKGLSTIRSDKREVKVVNSVMVISFLLIILGAFILGYFRGKAWNEKEYRELMTECLPIFYELEDEDFATAKIMDNEIVLYDKEQLKIKSVPCCEDLSREILYISNEDNNIRFWHKGFDDVEGLMIMKSDFDVSSFDGLNHIRKLQENVYVVYTYQ